MTRSSVYTSPIVRTREGKSSHKLGTFVQCRCGEKLAAVRTLECVNHMHVSHDDRRHGHLASVLLIRGAHTLAEDPELPNSRSHQCHPDPSSRHPSVRSSFWGFEADYLSRRTRARTSYKLKQSLVSRIVIWTASGTPNITRRGRGQQGKCARPVPLSRLFNNDSITTFIFRNSERPWKTSTPLLGHNKKRVVTKFVRVLRSAEIVSHVREASRATVQSQRVWGN